MRFIYSWESIAITGDYGCISKLVLAINLHDKAHAEIEVRFGEVDVLFSRETNCQ